jgi:hypothetical protein
MLHCSSASKSFGTGSPPLALADRRRLLLVHPCRAEPSLEWVDGSTRLKKTYPWPRFWIPRDEELKLLAGAYLPNPDDDYSRFYNPKLSTFAAFCNAGCNVLLGEGGMGKSRCLQKEHESLALTWETQKEAGVLIDVGDVSSVVDLNFRLVQNKSIQRWLKADGVLHLSLDAVDEALARFPMLPKALLDELNSFPRERLRLAIVCRAGEWPPFLENGLATLYGIDGIGVWQLTPLRQEDVRIAATGNGLDADRFFDTLSERELAPLAARPLTLELLLRSVSTGSELPDDVRLLYERGCTALLCEDPDSSRSIQVPRLDANQKIAVAGRIACATLFSASAVVNIAPADALRSGAVGLEDLAGGVEAAGESSFSVGTLDVQEVLRSSLFTGFASRFCWSHKSFAEFLAARHLRNSTISLTQIMRLLGAAGQVAPALAGVAAWLASMREDVRLELLRVDPEVLLEADLSTSRPEIRAELIRWLVRQAEAESPFIHQWDLFWKYRKLAHSDLGQQLESLLDGSRPGTVRSLAIQIANACGGVDITGLLADLALRDTEPVHLRIEAAWCVTSHGTSSQKASLGPVAFRHSDDTDQQRLQAQALSAVWPDHASWTRIRDDLGGSDYDQTSPLGRFIAHDLAPGIPVDKFGEALAWLAENHPSPSPLSAWAGAADRLLMRAVRHASDAAVRRGITDLLFARISQHHHMFDEHVLTQRQSYNLGPAHLRRLIAADLIPRFAQTVYRVVQTLRGPAPLLLGSDLGFAIDRWRAAPGDIKPVWEATIGFLTDWQNPESCSAVFELVGDSQVLKGVLRKWQLNRRIGARRESDDQTERRDALERKRAARLRYLHYLLRRSESDAPHFSRLMEAMSCELDEGFSKHLFNPNIRELPGWSALTASETVRVLEAGKLFLEYGSSYMAVGLRRGATGRHGLAAYKILRELMLSEPGYLEAMPEKLWRKWTPAIVLFQASAADQEYGDPDQRLFELAAARARGAATFAVAALVRADRVQDPERALARLAKPIRSPQFDRVVFNAITRPKTSEGLYMACMTMLFEHGHVGARPFVENQLTSLNSSPAQEELSRIARGATLWLAQDREHAWPKIWKEMKTNPAFAKLLLGLPDRDRRRAKVIAEWLPDIDSGDLFRWLRSEFGAPPEASRFNQEPVHSFQGSILQWLQQRRSASAVAVLEQLEREYSTDWWIRKSVWEARRLILENAWEPLEPAAVRRVVEDRRHMLVRDENELMDAVLEALQEFQATIRSEGDRVRRLWNEYHVGHALCCKPKPEEPLSREIALELGDLLGSRGVTAKLEVKIREGEYVDIYVSAVTAGSKPRPISLIIEVKGCWNPSVKTSLDAQLAQRYLKENLSGLGIYLVAWFMCERWDERDNKRKAQAPKESVAELRAFLEAQAFAVSSATRTSIRALVFDATLPDLGPKRKATRMPAASKKRPSRRKKS